MSASWKSDPTGRHQVRWWDGQNWTDHVADDGVTATDSFLATPPPPVVVPPTPTPPTSTASSSATGEGTVVFAAQPAAPSSPVSSTPMATPPFATSPSASPTPPTSAPGGAPSYLAGGSGAVSPVAPTSTRKFPTLPVVGGVLVAIVLIVVLVFIIGGGGDDGPSTVIGDIRDDELLAITLSGDQGDIVVVDVRPDDDLDVVFGLLLSRDQLRDFYDDFADVADTSLSFSEFADQFRSADDFDLGDLEDDFAGGFIFQEGDSSSEGGRERGWLALPSNGRFAVVAFAYDGFGSGEVELSIERCSDPVPIEDLIDAGGSDEEFDLAQEACGDIRVPFNS